MSELSRRLMVTGGNVTGLADQLEREGLLLREAVPGDRRAIRLMLTPSGRARFADMARAHESWVVSLMSELSATEQRTLRDLLGRLKTSLHQEGEHDVSGLRTTPSTHRPTPGRRSNRPGEP